MRHTSDTVKFLKYGWDLFIRDGMFEEYKKPLLIRAQATINNWYERIKGDKEYTQKWLNGCYEAIREYFGDMARLLDLRVCAAGSYSLHNSVLQQNFRATLGNNKKSVEKYCFTGLISYMSDKTSEPPVIDNPFRQKALDMDFKKTLKKDISDGCFSHMVLDFLDERYDIAESDGGYYTISDAFTESAAALDYKTLDRWDGETVKLWEEKCLELIELLKSRFKPNDIILVKNYLAEEFGTFSRRESFDNHDEIKRINANLRKCYEFFEARLPGVKIIDINGAGLCYSDENFRHDCAPWHYNQEYYAELREKITNLLMEGTK